MSCEHDDEDCECLEEAFNMASEDDLVKELRERGIEIIDRQTVENGYEAVMRGNLVEARRYLKAALYPNGGADLVALRVRPDLQRHREAPGAHGQVGQSEADAERAGVASQANEKAA
jgi:hypothetical protein